MDSYLLQMLKVVIAQVCQKVGWQAIKEFPLELLSDVLDRFLKEFTKELSKYVEFCGRIQPNLEDVAMVADQMSINLHELYEFIKNVDPVPCLETPKLPIAKQNSLNILRSGESELIHRPSHFQDHFPSIKIITNGIDKVKNDSEDAENITEGRIRITNSSFKLPALFPKEESVCQRNDLDEECKGVPFGNSSLQMDKFGFIRVSGALGKTASSKPPVFSVTATKPFKIENLSTVDALQSNPPLIEKDDTIDKPKTPPPKKTASTELPSDTPAPEVLALKKERKKKKLLQMQEKQQRKELKHLQKAIASEKITSLDKPSKASEKTISHSTNILPPAVLVEAFEEANQIAEDDTKTLDFSQPKKAFESTSVETPIMPFKHDTIQKISSEPDKNKLNIFKKISVKKDFHLPNVLDVDGSHIDNFNLPFGTTITPAPPTESSTDGILPCKPKELKIKEPSLVKNKESFVEKVKQQGKTKDITIISTDISSKKDDLMSSFAARAMMSIIGSAKSHEEQTVKVISNFFIDKVEENVLHVHNGFESYLIIFLKKCFYTNEKNDVFDYSQLCGFSITMEFQISE